MADLNDQLDHPTPPEATPPDWTLLLTLVFFLMAVHTGAEPTAVLELLTVLLAVQPARSRDR